MPQKQFWLIELFESINTVLQFFGVNLSDIVAGFSGGIVRFIRKDQENRNFWRFCASGLVGALCAAYMAHPIALILVSFGGDAIASRGVAGFIVGMSGLYIADAILKGIIARISLPKPSENK